MADQQRKVTFRGDVQGVGFRYTACQVAGDFDVVGYVRNAPDGSVELLAEGADDQLDAFLDALNSRMRGHIRDIDQQAAPAEGRYHDFGVRF